MGVDSEICGNSGTQHTIEYNGKTYTAMYIDGRFQSLFEKRLYERYKKVEIDLKAERTPDAYQARLDKLADEFLNGEFALMSERAQTFLSKLPGMVFLAGLLLGCPEEEVLPLVVAKAAEIRSLFMLIVKESFPGFDIDAALAQKKEAEEAVKQLVEKMGYEMAPTAEAPTPPK